MQTDTGTYFAYGSNMATRRLRARTPLALSLGRAYVRGWRLNSHKLALEGLATCRMRHTGLAHDRVYGVRYSIRQAEQPALDRAEGLGFAYRAESISVVSDGRALAAADPLALAAPLFLAVQAKACTAVSLAETALPYHGYTQCVLAGAMEHGLPAPYVALIQSVVSQDDPDTERQCMNSAILEAAAAV